MKRHIKFPRPLAGLLLLAAFSARAQTAAPPPADATIDPEKVILDELVVTNQSSTKTALPVRPVTGVYGFETDYQDVPRSLTQINPKQFEQDLIASYSDFTRYSPSVNQATGQLNNYGSATIRGSVSDVYQNGVRMLVRQGNNRPFTLNAYEAADIVAGPAPVIYGPSARTAGYTNYVTKKPYFDGTHGSVTFRLGKLYADGSGFDDSENWLLDFGGPILPGKLAYRVSYQGENTEAFQWNVHQRYHDLYGSLGWLPTDRLTVDWNFEYGTFDWKVNNGYNRVTNALIRDGTYLAGPATPIIQGAFSGTATGYYSPVWVSGAGFDGTQFVRRTRNADGSYSVGTALTGAPTAAQAGTIVGYVLDPALVKSVALDPRAALNAPDYPSTTDAFNTQLRVKQVFNDHVTLLNNTIFQAYETDTASNGGFYNWIRSHTLENRTEGLFQGDYALLGLPVKHRANTGLSYRYEEVWNVKDAQRSGYGPTGDQFDLTGNPASFTRNAFFGGNVFPFAGTTSTPVLTRFGYLKGFYPYLVWKESPDNAVSPGGSDTTQPWLSSATNHTWTNSLSIYSQHSLQLGERWLLDAGYRQTRVSSSIRNPLPIDPANAAITDSYRRWIPGWSTSLSYKANKRVTAYATYAYVVATNGMTTGSPTWSRDGAVPNQFDPANFNSLSELRELGAKFQLVPDQLVGGLAVYRQTRDLTVTTVPGSDPVLSKGKYEGIEANLRYQPVRRFSAGVNFNYLSAQTLGQIVSAPNLLVADNSTNILGSTSLGFGNWRVTNLPRTNLTLFSSYEWESGFGIKADLWARGSYLVTNGGGVTVPAQHNLNVGFFYNQPKWSVALDVQNVTNERNFAGGSAQLEPISLQARFTQRF